MKLWTDADVCRFGTASMMALAEFLGLRLPRAKIVEVIAATFYDQQGRNPDWDGSPEPSADEVARSKEHPPHG